MDYKLTIPSYLDEKYLDCLLVIRTPEENNIHASWDVDGRIIVFEDIPNNWPSTSLSVFEDKEEYLEAIRGVSWICHEYCVIHRGNDIEKVLTEND